MAVDCNAVTVTTAPTPLNPMRATTDLAVPGKGGLITNVGAVDVYCGGPNVATSGAKLGHRLAPGFGLPVESTSDNDIVYGVVASGTGTVTVFEIGV